MNQLLRSIACAIDSLIYGPIYGEIKNHMRSPGPLDPEETWERLARPAGPMGRRYPPEFVRNLYINSRLKLDHIIPVARHYDVSNDFYMLILDKKYRFYSCADFIHGSETLEEAQENKANDVLRMLSPRPGERVLDLGCGWGGMLGWIYEATGDKENLFGYTLSTDQVAHNEQNGRYNVSLTNFVTTDYPEESFDIIYSIGAWEHVRPKEISGLLDRLYKALRPGGRMVHHFICMPSDTLPTTVIASQLFFPGSVLSSYKDQVRAFERAGFRVVEQSLHDYRDTLRSWFNNLVANRDRAIELVGVRRYNEYLTFYPAAWRFANDVEGLVVRFGLEKSGTRRPGVSHAREPVRVAEGLMSGTPTGDEADISGP